MLPFVRLFYSDPSMFLWEDDMETVHHILQGEGGKQGDPLMPLLFCLGQHAALVAVAERLEAGERPPTVTRPWQRKLTMTAGNKDSRRATVHFLEERLGIWTVFLLWRGGLFWQDSTHRDSELARSDGPWKGQAMWETVGVDPTPSCPCLWGRR